QPLDVPAHERLAARDAHGAHTEPGEDADDARDLLEAQELAALEEGVVPAEDLLRHAVDATEVAAVGDRHPQRLERPAERVEQRVHPRSVAFQEREGGERCCGYQAGTGTGTFARPAAAYASSWSSVSCSSRACASES